MAQYIICWQKGPADTQNAVLSLGPLEVPDSVEVLSAPFLEVRAA